MRSRSGSGVRLDLILAIAEKTILSQQDPVTALFANQQDKFPDHAWVRDNVYAAHAIWALYRAYQKCADREDDVVKADELGLTCVKLMQSLLECMMRQAEKVESFKRHQRSLDALHAKYSARRKTTVVGDAEWGHLQMDATSLFLLTLAQITASGLQIVRNFDEVAFIQNLVYYIESGYRTPDFGIWERGDKTNQGIRELNASSIGLVKAALQALNAVGDLFGDGSKGSVIHVLPDEIEQCSAVLSSMLPRESFSKETDAALLTIISYPGFAVEDNELVDATRDTIKTVLLGRYGCRRFLRDGYKTVLEDSSRLYYNKSELQQFEDIECEWPLFVCLLLLDALYRADKVEVQQYWEQLNELLVPDGLFRYLPELYAVEREHVSEEKQQRGTQPRTPAGSVPFMWAQSLYVMCCLLHEGFLSPSELDPLSRRLTASHSRPPCEVQVSVLADSLEVQEELLAHGIPVQLLSELDSVFEIRPASDLAKVLSKIGECKKLELTGRPLGREVGLLSTSRLYQVGNKFVIFTPQFMDRNRSHLMYDIRILMNEWSSELQYIYSSWNSVSFSAGRPLVVLVINKSMLASDNSTNHNFANLSMTRFMKFSVIGTLKKLSSGYIGGARVMMKNVGDFFRTTAVSKLELAHEQLEELRRMDREKEAAHLPSKRGEDEEEKDEGVGEEAPSLVIEPLHRTPRMRESVRDRSRYSMMHKLSMRHRSIVLDSTDADASTSLDTIDLVQLRLAYNRRQHVPETTPSPPPTAPIGGLTTSPFARSTPMAVPGSGNGSSNGLGVVHEASASPASRGSLLTTTARDGSGSSLSDIQNRLDHANMDEMGGEDLVEMLRETTDLEEQTTVIHYLWMKFGPDYDTCLEDDQEITVHMLMEEIYNKACESREWSLIRLSAGLLNRQIDELAKAVTHLLVRQKQLTVGMPPKKEEAITCPKTNEELKEIMQRAYADDPNACMLSQEIIVYLGSLVRTDPKLFGEMFRLRVGLIIQVLASELARLRDYSAADALQKLLTISPFELKSMLFMLLSGRLLEDTLSGDGGGASRDSRTGIGSFRKHIEDRKSMRKLSRATVETAEETQRRLQQHLSVQSDAEKSLPSAAAEVTSTRVITEEEPADSENDEEDETFGIWLRHRRIDGALNRVPPDFYVTVWDTVHRIPHGIRINGIVLHWGLTQEMTRREIKFALEVEEVLNQIPEPEYRQLVIEALWLLGRLERLTRCEQPSVPLDKPVDIDSLIQEANKAFIRHNCQMETEVLECCGSGQFCDGARQLCRHFYDSAPVGEFGTSHYIIQALCEAFT